MLKDNSECPKPNNNVVKLISFVTNDDYKKRGGGDKRNPFYFSVIKVFFIKFKLNSCAKFHLRKSNIFEMVEMEWLNVLSILMNGKYFIF
jgi:hypothetical protein